MILKRGMAIVPFFWRALWIRAIIGARVTVRRTGSTLAVRKAVAGRMFSGKAEQPGRAYCGVAEGDWPKIKAYYRFIDKPDDSAVTMPAILQPHRERTIQRMKAQKRVLCIQDGSDLNYSTLEGCEGLGFVGGKQSKGLHLHSTFAVTSSGLPLGGC